MAQENVEVVRRFEEMMIPSLGAKDSSHARGGFDEVLELLDPEIVLTVASSLLEYFDGGDDRVIIVVDPTFQSKATGKTIHHRMVEIFSVQNGKITRLVPYYWDTALLVEACGGVHAP